MQLRIPKLRKGSFFPVILEPRRRIDQALFAALRSAGGHRGAVIPTRPCHHRRRGDARAQLNERGDLLTASGEIVMTVDKRDVRCEP